MNIYAITLGILFVGLVILAASLWIRYEFSKLSRKALKEASQELMNLARNTFETERQKGIKDLEKGQQDVDASVKTIQIQLQRYEALMKDFEHDRAQKYGALENELKRVIQETDTLQHTTASLVGVLGNARVRGQWGQKMAEDILRSCGLKEGVHYVREKEIVTGRPDYTFLLPDERKLFMDVKFPLDNYLKFTEARNPEEQSPCRIAFIEDVRGHIREMEKRGYAEESEDSLDYIVLFIPNEQIYGVVNEWVPGLVDECLRKRIILCGPWTLYAVLRIIWEAWENYNFSVAMKEIIRAVEAFKQDYKKFNERFGDLGGLIEKVREKHREIAQTSYRRLETRIRQIDEYQKGERSAERVDQEEPVQTLGANDT